MAVGARLDKLIGLAAICAASTGCFSRTQALSPAEATPGEAGFGAALHEHWIYAVLVTSRTAFVASGQVAMVDDTEGDLPTDSLWQSYEGGRALRHCFVVGSGEHVCADAKLPEGVGGWGTSMVLVDPSNLGDYFAEVTVFGTDTERRYFFFAAYGGYESEDLRMPAGPTHGIWARVADRGGMLHCQLESDGVPRCRDLGDDFRPPDNILGVFVQGDTDVLWVSTDDRVHRCTASPTGPEPTCTPAKMN